MGTIGEQVDQALRNIAEIAAAAGRRWPTRVKVTLILRDDVTDMAAVNEAYERALPRRLPARTSFFVQPAEEPRHARRGRGGDRCASVDAGRHGAVSAGSATRRRRGRWTCCATAAAPSTPRSPARRRSAWSRCRGAALGGDAFALIRTADGDGASASTAAARRRPRCSTWPPGSTKVPRFGPLSVGRARRSSTPGSSCTSASARSPSPCCSNRPVASPPTASSSTRGSPRALAHVAAHRGRRPARVAASPGAHGPGSAFRQPDLAETLAAIAAEGRERSTAA